MSRISLKSPATFPEPNSTETPETMSVPLGEASTVDTFSIKPSSESSSKVKSGMEYRSNPSRPFSNLVERTDKKNAKQAEKLGKLQEETAGGGGVQVARDQIERPVNETHSAGGTMPSPAESALKEEFRALLAAPIASGRIRNLSSEASGNSELFEWDATLAMTRKIDTDSVEHLSFADLEVWFDSDDEEFFEQVLKFLNTSGQAAAGCFTFSVPTGEAAEWSMGVGIWLKSRRAIGWEEYVIHT